MVPVVIIVSWLNNLRTRGIQEAPTRSVSNKLITTEWLSHQVSEVSLVSWDLTRGIDA